MSSFYQNILIFIVGEAISVLIFLLVVRLFKKKLTLVAVLKGLLERGFLYTCLIHNLPHGLTLFAALKVATRLKDDETKVSNDYFLTGNIISVFIVIGYYLLATKYLI